MSKTDAPKVSAANKSPDTGENGSRPSGTSAALIEKGSTHLAQLTDDAARFHTVIANAEEGKLAATREMLKKDRQAAGRLCETLDECISQIDLRLELNAGKSQPGASPPSRPKKKVARKNRRDRKEEQADTA